MEANDRIKEIDAEISCLREKINALQIERGIEKQNYRAADKGVKIGDIVWDTRASRKAKFVRINSFGWAYVRLLKKDGSLYKGETCLYGDWKKLEEPAP